MPSGEDIRALCYRGRGPLPAQTQFLQTFDDQAAKIVVYRGGIGSGKSRIAAHYLIEKAARNQDVRGFVGANTYTQLWQSTLTALYRLCKEYGVPVRPDSPESAAKKKVLYLWDKVEILCRAAENQGYKTWDGFEVGYWWLDEPKDMDEGAYRTILERHRDNRVDRLEGWMSSSPAEGWYNDLEDDGELKIVTSDTRDNFYLPAGYVETLLGNMSVEMAAQQIEGKVINVHSGLCYPGFSRAENTRQLSIVEGHELIIGVDFNVEPGMHAYAMQIIKDDVYVIDEIYLRGGDTPALAKEIAARYGTNGIVIHPDAAGGHRSTTGTSDHQILRDAGFKIRCRPANPPIKNRINSVNARILNALGERHLFIDQRCKLLRKELEQCTWAVMQNTAYKGQLTHPGAAIGYPIEYKFPVTGGGFAVKLPKISQTSNKSHL